MYDDTCGLVHTVLITLAMLVAIAAFLTGTSLLRTVSSEGIAELSDGSTNYETTKEDDSFEKAIAEIERQQALEEEKKLQEQKAAESAAREAARIQTFPDDYIFTGSQNMWYAQVGNAVPVKLAEAIGKGIMKFL